MPGGLAPILFPMYRCVCVCVCVCVVCVCVCARACALCAFVVLLLCMRTLGLNAQGLGAQCFQYV
jgi:hypothetical protein